VVVDGWLLSPSPCVIRTGRRDAAVKVATQRPDPSYVLEIQRGVRTAGRAGVADSLLGAGAVLASTGNRRTIS